MLNTIGRLSTGALMVRRPLISRNITLPEVPNIISTNLLLHLDAGNISSYPGSGTTWTSLVGSYTASLGAGVSYTTASGISAMSFVGNSTGVATVNNASVLTNTTLNDLTIEAWYTANNSSGYKPQITATGSGSQGFVFGQFTSSPTNWKVTKYNRVDIYAGSIPQDSNWHQVVLTYSSSAPGVAVYIDGAVSGTFANTTSIINPSALTTLPIGKGESTYHNGKIAIFRFYNTALTSSQILQNFNAQKSRFGL